MINKNIISVSIACLFGMLLTTSLVADNLSDKHVYSFFTENFNGAAVDASRTDDNMGISVWNGGGDAYPLFPDGTNAPLIEGNKHYSFTVSNNGSNGWSGWCYTFKDASNQPTTKNISAFSTLEFYIRPKTGDISNIAFGITDSAGNKTKTLSSLGVNNSNKNWQKVSVSLSSFSGANLSQVKNIFLFVTSNITATFDLDYMVMKRSTMGGFDATLKNISDNQTATQITWDQSVFRTSWKASQQYIDLSLDTLTNDNWIIKIYTDNGAANKAGLVDSGGTSILPMCWRIHKEKIPCDGCTLSIAQGGAPNYGLYDSGISASDPSWYPWFYFVDKADEGFDTKTDYVTIWSYKGFHGAAGNYYGMSDMIPTGVYPKLYFGANFENAMASSPYSASIKLELSYE